MGPVLCLSLHIELELGQGQAQGPESPAQTVLVLTFHHTEPLMGSIKWSKPVLTLSRIQHPQREQDPLSMQGP